MVHPILIIALILVAHQTTQAAEHQLWYNQAAKNWDQALPIGNGRIGAKSVYLRLIASTDFGGKKNNMACEDGWPTTPPNSPLKR